MNPPSIEARPAVALFPPIILVVLAFNLFLLSELHARWNDVSALRRASESLAERTERARADLPRSRTAQAALEGLANDLILLGNTDPDVRRIVDKHQIRKTTPPAAAETPGLK